MAASSQPDRIRLRGVRHNNLKGFDLDLPLNQIIVVTGLSGSGKSSLAFDTLYAEGQRRYIETFSPYARQFFDRMDKPRVDSIEGIPPAIAIEQKNTVRSTRSTVGTMTEICDHMKVLWPHLAQLYCRSCGRAVHKESPQHIWKAARQRAGAGGIDLLVTFDLPLSEKLSVQDSLALIARQGYQRLMLGREVVRLDDAESHPALRASPRALTVIQDRLRLRPSNRGRFIEACEQAYHFGKGHLTLHQAGPDGTRPWQTFSAGRHCATCDLDYPEPTPALFSFNHPVGACPSCKGFGRVIGIDYDLAIPDRSKTLAGGAVKPWQTGMSAECQRDLMKFCRASDVPADVPFNQLSEHDQRWIIEGDPDYGIDEEHEWPRAWYGVKGYFRWLESKAYKMHVRVLLSRYRSYTPCPDCHGTRLKPDAQLYHLELSPAGRGGTARRLTLPDFYALPIWDAKAVTDALRARHPHQHNDPIGSALEEVCARLGYLVEVGLGYLTLDRPTRSLSGGETERVNLTTCLGTRLVNTLFVLDEPSVGLHPRDTERLVTILERLRDTGNTVLVVEHEAGVMRAADQIIDLGPGHGNTGGELVFQGSFKRLLRSRHSLTGRYLSGRASIGIPERRVVEVGLASSLSANLSPTKDRNRREACPTLNIRHATKHNLRDLSVRIPLGRFVCLTGVSGSGKSTLAREVLVPALQHHLGLSGTPAKASDRMLGSDGTRETSTAPTCQVEGWQHLGAVVVVDQASLGKTPRSNPVVYVGAFDHIRELFARTEDAHQRGLNASAFSFNSAVGQCERCRGAGFEKVEMQFLSDVFIRCPDCDGRRYRDHILEVKLASGDTALSIADLLEATVDEAVTFLNTLPPSTHAARAGDALNVLQQVGLGYLQLGQPINTLSGGESQRLKLATHLAAASRRRTGFQAVSPKSSKRPRLTQHAPDPSSAPRPSLFVFDEPTTGLHFDDIRILLDAFQQLVDAGHSLLVIEHNLDVIKCADWLIDLGPEAGTDGGRVVVAGTPETVAACAASHTGHHLSGVLNGEDRS